MQNMGIKEKQGYKTFCDVMFVLLCAAIVIGIIALGIWVCVTFFGFTW